MPRESTLRSGARLGFEIAAVVWLWIMLVDLVAGAPLRTFSALGGVVAFSLVHCVLSVGYATILVSVVRAARSEPTLMAGLVFASLLLELAFVMVTVVLASAGLGTVAWVQIFGGSLIAGAVAIVYLARRHPLGNLLHRAHEQL